jgi:hypothetical protein
MVAYNPVASDGAILLRTGHCSGGVVIRCQVRPVSISAVSRVRNRCFLVVSALVRKPSRSVVLRTRTNIDFPNLDVGR